MGADSELVEFLRSLGATDDDLAGDENELVGLASVIAIRSGPLELTMEELADAAGMTGTEARRLRLALGFAEPEADALVASRADIELYKAFAVAAVWLGTEPTLQLARVLGAAMARLADAIVSTVLVNIERPLLDEPDSEMRIARSNAEAAALLPGLLRTLDLVFRGHLLAARRSLADYDTAGGVEVQELAIGFADLVSSTALMEQLSLGQASALVGAFAETTSSIITGRGGRLVKLIGDEVMFVTREPGTAAAVALDIAAAIAADDRLPGARVGVASGPVLSRDGDVFGPPVNLAARIVKHADPGTVLVTTLVANAPEAEHVSRSIGHVRLEGIAEPVELWSLTRPTTG